MKTKIVRKRFDIITAVFFGILFCFHTTMVMAEELAGSYVECKAGRSDHNYNNSRDCLYSQNSILLLDESVKFYSVEEQLAEKKAIRNFVLFNYAHVADDIINGKGMYLATVYSLLGIKPDDQEGWRKVFLEILLQNKRIPDFSKRIAEYGKNRR